MCRRPPRRFLQKSRIALKKENVVEEIETERTKVEKGGEKPPILPDVSTQWLALDPKLNAPGS